MSSFFEILNKDIGITDVVCMSQHFKNSESYTYTNQTPRKYCGLLIILCKAAVYSNDGEALFTARYGDIVYMPKGSYYKITFDNPENRPYSSILIDFNFITKSNGDFSGQHPQLLIKNGDIFISDFLSIVEIYMAQKEKSLKIKAQLFNLMTSLAEYNVNSKGSIDRSTWYIENNLDKPLRVPELAKMCAESQTKFRADFKAYTGMSPNQYILTLKTEKACKMLSEGESAVSAIAQSLGFYDNAHFYRIFKRITGMTPIEYKNSLVGK